MTEDETKYEMYRSFDHSSCGTVYETKWVEESELQDYINKGWKLKTIANKLHNLTI